ncbi:MAG: hypothetical protein HOW73_08225 [Polyangiaceae bacterium]|nr:hypothetical protein [Polyangiaceae bacterium]
MTTSPADRFADYRARAKKHGLSAVIDAIEEAVGDDWKLIHFVAPPPKSKAANEAIVAAAEARYGGKLPAKIRKSLLAMYAASDGFSFALAPLRMPAPDEPGSEEVWGRVEGPFGYLLLPLAEVLADGAGSPIRGEEPFIEGGIEELSATDLEGGVEPQSTYFTFSDSLEYNQDRGDLRRTYTEYKNSAIALKTAEFPGGYLSQDGDLQWTLIGDEEERRPSLPSFAEHLAEQFERILEGIKDYFHAVSLPEESEETTPAEARKTVTGPLARAPSVAPDWTKTFVVSDALGVEAAQLREFFARFAPRGNSNYRNEVEIVPDDASYDDVVRERVGSNCRVIRQRELRRHLPSHDVESRLARLRAALAAPTSPLASEALAEATMLLLTWDDATLPRAVEEAKKALSRWPVAVRTFQHPVFYERPELAALVIEPPYIDDRITFAARSPQVRILNIGDNDVQRVDELHGALGHITHLDIDLRKSPARDALARWTGLTGLVQLNLHGCDEDIDPTVVEIEKILTLPHLRGVEELNLLSCKLTKMDLRALAAAPQKLRMLRIKDSLLGFGGEGSLLAAVVSAHRLEELTLDECSVKDIRGLFESPDDWRSMQRFSWAGQALKDAGALVKARFESLRELRLEKPEGLTKDHIKALASSSTFSKLEHLAIRFCSKLGAEAAAALLTSRTLRSLRHLELSFCDVAFPALVKACGRALEGPPVERLSLEYLKSSPGKVDWNNATFLRTVRELRFGGLDGDAQATFWSCPHIARLEELALGDAYGKEDVVAKALAAAAPPPGLRTLETSIALDDERAALIAGAALGQKVGGITVDMRNDRAQRVLFESGLAFVPSRFETDFMERVRWVGF